MATKHEAQGGQRVLYGFWLSPFMSLVAQMLKESGLDFRYERNSDGRSGRRSNGRTGQCNGASRKNMSQKKTMTKRRSWAQIKQAKGAGEERRTGYRQAKEAFELAERVLEARERLGI